MSAVDRGATQVNGAPADSPSAIAPSVVVRRPAALLYGPAQVIVYGNPPFVAAFGEAVVGLPAREALLEFPPGAFELMALVFETNRPLASWIKIRGIRTRLIAAPRRDIETDEVYGIAIRLVPGT